MNHYFDIHVLVDPEFPETQLMETLYGKLHRTLVELRTDRIGVSFPKVKVTLGNVMRLHGSDVELRALRESKWLAGLSGHVNITDVQPIPGKTRHRRVRRVQFKSNVERLRRRLMKRHGVSHDVACQRIPDNAAQTTNLPFLSFASTSTGQRFQLFVSHEPLCTTPTLGPFNSYGLSLDGATTPWF